MDEREESLVRIEWQPSAASLRSFGAALVCVLAWSLVNRYRSAGALALRDPLGLASGSLTLAVAALAVIRPELLRLPYVALGTLTYPARWLVAFLSLALLFYGLVTPIAVCVRLVRKHRARSGDPDHASGWVVSRPRPDKAHYFRQF
jgi:hypothetical protein